MVDDAEMDFDGHKFMRGMSNGLLITFILWSIIGALVF